MAAAVLVCLARVEGVSPEISPAPSKYLGWERCEINAADVHA